jgi:mycofactocin precursor
MTMSAITVSPTTPSALSAITGGIAVAEPQKPTSEAVANDQTHAGLVGADLIEEVSIDGMCGVY